VGRLADREIRPVEHRRCLARFGVYEQISVAVVPVAVAGWLRCCQRAGTRVERLAKRLREVDKALRLVGVVWEVGAISQRVTRLIDAGTEQLALGVGVVVGRQYRQVAVADANAPDTRLFAEFVKRG